ncbi:3-phosphoserine/phosphohydroxythreonine transaminase [Buchnera aphidicola]|uniref:Phosphoserine aminotransferase n=1 Tax=Buchnera aphidicola subsp. Cinara cedri (strain Cc) TaxID=372461 RepID=SERC_BUCCC|nr:3-phosphoserine/phosphohydroxythreonine transaminase [Buchnera aphidicola]Q057N5.1 RecName: Full=Phosphoserine aminotransferase; AltName: Full=Phosphohydroxythreonine aminotransferase; Short=PSAT [Buchnera aphidicola BCc]ABJ90664.1 phosphoserine aminotransferase [Buchnera aphidicola BCc]
MSKIYNFNPGPAMLPKEVLLEIKKNFLNWNNSGFSITEISHRSSSFIEFTIQVEKDLRNLLHIPENYNILFSHGGARGQFSAIPMNLIKKFKKPDYINSGYWSKCAAKEAKKYCEPNIINVKRYTKNKQKYIESPINWKITSKHTYLHYCPNETIEGIEIFEEPILLNKIIIGDFSSTILSRKINIKKYGMIYACAQKNIGPAGITIIIIRNDLLISCKKKIPSILDYQLLFKSKSMLNTPSIFSWYVSGLVFKWIKNLGGLNVIEKKNIKKAKILYKYLNSTNFYYNCILPSNQSRMNVTFNLYKNELTNFFIQESEKSGLYGLKGHSIIGGLRASIYNAMPIEGVKKLIQFMKNFEKKFG